MLTGCAARQRRDRSAPVSSKKVSLRSTWAGRRSPASGPLHSDVKKAQDAATRTPPHTSTFGATVEGSDKALSAALLLRNRCCRRPTVTSRVAQEYRTTGDPRRCIRQTESRDCRWTPRMPRAHEGLARIWRDWGVPASALGVANRAVAYDARIGQSRRIRSERADALGRFDQAREAYRAAAALAPDAGRPLNNLCNLEYRLGRFEEARTYCEAAIAVDARTQGRAQQPGADVRGDRRSRQRAGRVPGSGRRGGGGVQPRHRLRWRIRTTCRARAGLRRSNQGASRRSRTPKRAHMQARQRLLTTAGKRLDTRMSIA